MRTPTRNAWKLRKALQALVERGIEGEAETAGRKLHRLESRYDFSAGEMESLFSGKFHRSGRAVFLTLFEPGEMTVAGFVKWAIENGTKIPAIWRNDGLWVEADSESLPRLQRLADTVRIAFVELWRNFAAAPGVRSGDRQLFMLGLYDGMMADSWQAGKALPVSAPAKNEKRGKSVARTGLTLHPYSVAVELGQGIRFNTPIAELTDQLSATVAHLTP